MDDKQFDRNKSITSSEISAVLGINPWQTPLKLWAIKTGQIEADDLSENESIEWGVRHEPLIAEAFAEKNNCKLMAYKRRFYHERFPFISCELDRLIVGTDVLVEIKTADARMSGEWAEPDQIPSHYICQVMLAMGLSKRKGAWIAVLIGGNRYMQKWIEFDQEFYDDMIAKAVIFMGLVERREAPSAIMGDDQVLLALHPKSDGDIQMLQEFETAVARRQELSGQIDQMKKEKEEIEVKIKESIGDMLGFKTERYKVLWTPVSTTRIDTDAIKKAGLFDQYSKTSESRRLTIKLNKG